MRKLNIIITGLFLISLSCLFSCSGNSGNGGDSDSTITSLEKKMDTIESGSTDSLSKSGKLGKEYTAKYICPDHCKGSGSDKPGTCADCGMELIENTAYKVK